MILVSQALQKNLSCSSTVYTRRVEPESTQGRPAVQRVDDGLQNPASPVGRGQEHGRERDHTGNRGKVEEAGTGQYPPNRLRALSRKE